MSQLSTFKSAEQEERHKKIMSIITDFEKKYPGKNDEIINAVISCLVKHSNISADTLLEEITTCLSWVEDMIILNERPEGSTNIY